MKKKKKPEDNPFDELLKLTKLIKGDRIKIEPKGFVKGAKGKKDRRTILSKHLVKLLRTYYKEYLPAYWLFEGQDGGQYSKSSIQKIFRKA